MVPPRESQPALGAAIRQTREGRKISQAELGDIAGINPTWISHIESGRINPAWGTVRRIAAALDVQLSKLAELAEEGEK